MSQFGQKLVGVLFWLVMIFMWVILVRQHKAGPANITYSVQYLSIVTGAVLAITIWWIRHNQRIFREEGSAPRPRRDPAEPGGGPPRPPLTWAVRGGTYQASRARHLVVDVEEDGRKVYRRP